MPTPPKKPGLIRRETDLAAALREERDYQRENTNSQGSVSTRQAVARARNALKRQQRANK